MGNFDILTLLKGNTCLSNLCSWSSSIQEYKNMALYGQHKYHILITVITGVGKHRG